jgi:multisubunit Na+/H+ antiporter MnhF subunit
MSEATLVVLNFSLIFMVILLPFSFYRVWIGRGLADRLLALEMVTALIIGIAIIYGLITNSDMSFDVGIILAALGFAGTMSIARYIAEGRVF